MIDYHLDAPLEVADIVRVLDASGIQRPTQDTARIGRMFAAADIVVSAWSGDTLVGLCRALTDFSYCCYLSDLAVDRAFQHRGIGSGLITQLRAALGEEVSIVLLSAPAAMGYYPRQGFSPADNAFVLKRAR
ncbi:MAG: GNAT family N-acetyltransferase [Zoogloea sp.]|nr:GNAT family N-acetyltransferase [Zoogloea sp.]